MVCRRWSFLKMSMRGSAYGIARVGTRAESEGGLIACRTSCRANTVVVFAPGVGDVSARAAEFGLEQHSRFLKLATKLAVREGG